VCGKGAARNAGASSPRPVTRPVRCAPVPRVGPALFSPAGPPLRPSASATPQPPRPAGRRVAAAGPPGSARAPASRSGGPHGPPLRETAGSPLKSGRRARGPKSTRPGPRRCAPLRLNACTAFALAAPTVPAIARSWTTRAQNPPRCCAAPRVPLLALRLAFSVSLLRSLHSQREPPGSRPSPIAPGLAPGANHAALRAAQAALAASASHQAIAAASLGQPRSCRIIRPPRLPAFLTMNTLAALA